MKIAIIGTGNVARSVAALWLHAGHSLHFGSRHAESARQRLAALGGGVQIGGIAGAADDGDVIFCAAPYGSWPGLAAEIGAGARGKVVIDAANPYPERDGAFATAAIEAGKGAGVPVAQLLGGARLVRAFNCVAWPATADKSNRDKPEIAIPLAGDDADARAVVSVLIRDAGFEPVDAGALVQARLFDPGAALYGHPMSAPAMRKTLGL